MFYLEKNACLVHFLNYLSSHFLLKFWAPHIYCLSPCCHMYSLLSHCVVSLLTFDCFLLFWSDAILFVQFCFCFLYSAVSSKDLLLIPMPWRVCPMFLSSSFVVCGFTLKTFYPFWLVSVIGETGVYFISPEEVSLVCPAPHKTYGVLWDSAEIQHTGKVWVPLSVFCQYRAILGVLLFYVEPTNHRTLFRTLSQISSGVLFPPSTVILK